MSELLDQAFPPDECIPDDELDLAMHRFRPRGTDEPRVPHLFFMEYGAKSLVLRGAQVHIQSPFTLSYDEAMAIGVSSKAVNSYKHVIARYRKEAGYPDDEAEASERQSA